MKREMAIVGMWKIVAAITINVIGEVKRLRAKNCGERLRATSWTLAKLERL